MYLLFSACVNSMSSKIQRTNQKKSLKKVCKAWSSFTLNINLCVTNLSFHYKQFLIFFYNFKYKYDKAALLRIILCQLIKWYNSFHHSFTDKLYRLLFLFMYRMSKPKATMARNKNSIRWYSVEHSLEKPGSWASITSK